MVNKWIQFVKDFADKNNLSYSDALKNPKCKDGYKSKCGKIKGKIKGGSSPTSPYELERILQRQDRAYERQEQQRQEQLRQQEQERLRQQQIQQIRRERDIFNNGVRRIERLMREFNTSRSFRRLRQSEFTQDVFNITRRELRDSMVALDSMVQTLNIITNEAPNYLQTREGRSNLNSIDRAIDDFTDSILYTERQLAFCMERNSRNSGCVIN